jgi:SAM-dependent methyltransferase
MKSEGNVKAARGTYLERRGSNLEFLLRSRFEWMNTFIREGSFGIEVGAGIAASKDFIDAAPFVTTDFSDGPWLDQTNVDALDLPFPDKSFDFLIASNMIHHVPYPMRFFDEASRVLKPGGNILIQEIHTSLGMKAVLRAMRHEGWDEDAPVFSDSAVCTSPDDLWSANCAIPRLLFDDHVAFESRRSDFRVVHDTHAEFLTFLNSGGVIAKTANVELPERIRKRVFKLDGWLSRSAPNVFALQRRIVLERT